MSEEITNALNLLGKVTGELKLDRAGHLAIQDAILLIEDSLTKAESFLKSSLSVAETIKEPALPESPPTPTETVDNVEKALA